MPSSFFSKLLWGGIALLLLGSLAILSFARGEPVNALWLVVAGVCDLTPLDGTVEK